MTLRRQMILRIAVPTLVIYVLIMGVTTYLAYRQSRESVRRTMTRLANSYAARFDGHLREAAQIADTTAHSMEAAGLLRDENVYRLLERNVDGSPIVYGACVAFEPGTAKPAGVLFAPYVFRNEGALKRIDIDQTVYDWYRDPRYTWFSAPKSLGQPVWSNPYFDEGAGNVLMATYSAPFRFNESFGGVTTVDIDLPRLHKTVGGDFEEPLDFVVLNRDGRFVYDRDPSRIMTRTIFDVAAQQNNPALDALGRRMLQGASGVAQIESWDSSERQWVFFTPIKSANWVFACRLPESRILADVRQRTIGWGAALSVTLLLIVACVVVVSRLISAPIVALKEKVLEVGGGNLDARINGNSRTEEIRQLARSFNRMTSELRSHVQRLATEQAARQRIEHDLDIAREIQRGLLPTATPLLAGYELAGLSLPADKTGGDYYDWQTAPDGRTLVTLADVTGHGVGPALVTAVCRAYSRAGFATGHEFAKLIGHLNDLLVADLAGTRFVTFAAALLDPQTQHVELISAGHGPIVHYIAAEHRLFEYNGTELPLGIISPLDYAPAVRIDLRPGDLLLLITDGFFEWAKTDGERFGLKRLRQSILESAHLPTPEVIARIHATVREFAGGAPQGDDVTAVAIRRSSDMDQSPIGKAGGPDLR
jgi:sigma-B regulation protein RsbU (phosphoserine phosphatase)